MRHRPIVGALLLCLLSLFALTTPIARGQSPQSAVVISQVYGGGGNSGADYTHDFIELFNRGEVPVSLTGWSVQYASATGASWQQTALTGTIPPGGYYLIQQAQGSGGRRSLPVPDAIGAIPMSAASGKVALLNTDDLLPRGTICPSGSGLVDLVGFGKTDCYTGGGAAPGLDNKTAALRVADGCAQTEDNQNNFISGPPAPRNSAASPRPCAGSPTLPSAPAIAPSRVGLTRTLPSLVPSTTLTGAVSALTPTIETALSGGEGLVISQIYGGGGNAGATYTHDFVELRNATPLTVALDGWSLQYASATGKKWLVTTLTGRVLPGETYLIQQAQGAGGTLPLPPADAIGETAMSASSGKIALVRGVDPLIGLCPRGETVVDFVGYGDADCFEGESPAARPSNTQAIHRSGNGWRDTNDNRADFTPAPPTPQP